MNLVAKSHLGLCGEFGNSLKTSETFLSMQAFHPSLSREGSPLPQYSDRGQLKIQSRHFSAAECARRRFMSLRRFLGGDKLIKPTPSIDLKLATSAGSGWEPPEMSSVQATTRDNLLHAL
jgi:hypothetical protein